MSPHSHCLLQVSAELRQLTLTLFDRHLTVNGRRVNYRAMATDPVFLRFTTVAAELQGVRPEALSREESMCFWINLYNCAIVHATVVFGPASSTLERLRWFDAVGYVIGGQKFSCNDIEHGVLRGNAPSPASLLSLLGLSRWAPATFGPGDPRAALALTPVDPRIHFALNCGAASCPPIRVFVPGRLEAGLTAAAAAFCAGEVEVDVGRGVVTLSSIFKWYGGDFGAKSDLIKFLVGVVPEGTKAQLQEVVSGAGGADKVTLRFAPYDWSTNAVLE